MFIQKTHRAVSTLSRLLPDAFVFVIDTTDRTFLFKSSEKEECQSILLKLDEDMGIDKLMNNQGHCFKNFCSREIGIKYLGTNTYVGFCLEELLVRGKSLTMAQEAVVSKLN